MSAGWTAGSVRGRLLARRRLGAEGARRVAAAGDVPAAVALVAASAYGRDVRAGMSAEQADRAVGAVCLWHLRVLAGWLPPRAGSAVRVFAAGFELDDLADRLAGVAAPPAPYPLGALAVTRRAARQARTPDAARAAIAASAWGDPGGAGWPQAAPALRARWAGWLADAVPDVHDWAPGAAALVVADALATGTPLAPQTAAELDRLLGRGWRRAPDVRTLAARLPRAARWVLDDGLSHDGPPDDEASDHREPDAAQRARSSWWRRVEADAAAAVRSRPPGRLVVASAAAVLVADARRVRAALHAAGWGPLGPEVLDAVA